MDIQITIKLHMDDTQLRDWAHTYGLDMSDASSDATGHIGELLKAAVEMQPHVKEFTTITKFAVK